MRFVQNQFYKRSPFHVQTSNCTYTHTPHTHIHRHRGLRYARAVYQHTKSPLALDELHALCVMLSQSGGKDAKKLIRETSSRLLLCNTGITTEIQAAIMSLETKEEERCDYFKSVRVVSAVNAGCSKSGGSSKDKSLLTLAVHLVEYVRALAPVLHHHSVLWSPMLHLLVKAWNVRTRTSFELSPKRPAESAQAANLKTDEVEFGNKKNATPTAIAKYFILATSIALSLPCLITPISLSPVSLLENDIRSILDFFSSLGNPLSPIISGLDWMCCLTERAVSDLIKPSVKLLLSRAGTERIYRGRNRPYVTVEQYQTDKWMTVQKSSEYRLPPLCEALLGPCGDGHWTSSSGVSQSDVSFVRLSVTLHTYSLHR